jgi:hypothetical protein
MFSRLLILAKPRASIFRPQLRQFAVVTNPVTPVEDPVGKKSGR